MSITDSGTFDATLFGEGVDAFTAGALVVEGTKEGTIAIKGDALDAAEFPIGVFDAAFAFGELFVFTGLASLFGEEQRALEALATIAVGVIELLGGMHGQTDGAARSAISQTSKRGFTV